jgi:MoaA/NifB/PqqE/SkfB family radical SAM enzyme
MKIITSAYPKDNQIKIEWNLGRRCNYDCSYCPSTIHDNFSKHTDIDILKNTVDKITSLNKFTKLSLTGGEPSVHPKIKELLKYIKNKKIDYLNLTTNGTRTSEWYSDSQQYIDHINFSLHFESDWQRVFNTITSFKEKATIDFFVNVMAHHEFMNEVKYVTEKFNDLSINYAIRRIRWVTTNQDEFNDNKYNESDLNWILNNTATAKPDVKISDGSRIYLKHSNDLIKEQLNNYKGYECFVGLESLMINHDGEVYRATCRVGGSLGNIYENTFNIPDNSITCTRNFCTCAADIPITKQCT